ncbi:PD-(D/E)XK nuclease family protein [Carboxylicivirga sp. N1Y90]|uniref:PDDEXK-like family protein n=1 Tax=Carboxylicivirga fragile TaxID=3417571 RepID=UPI003D3531C3|nr:PD-(D/E)XK nuclease family protein [Marinilabiliaceae bacterium N1Y90]
MIEIKSLLNQVKAKLEEAEKIAKLKGENFNIFSILNMESAENKTHSAFLCEILNSDGNHGFNDVFLKLFLKRLKAITPENPILTKFTTEGAKVTAELSIGKIDYEAKTGGRLDIVITDIAGQNIIIENKIYATDQEIQIERYCNYQSNTSVVFYLTLEGTEPAEKSYGNKKADKDFYLLSYADDIIDWLSQCQKEATDSPIVRESIKQYNILLKKLTNQLTTNAMSQEIKDIIKRNLKGAKGIADYYHDTVNEIKDSFRQKVRHELKELKLNVNEEWFVEITKPNAYICIDTEMPLVKFFIETFNGTGRHSFHNLNVGIWVNKHELKNNFEVVKKVIGDTNEGYWFERTALGMDLSDLDEVSKLSDNQYSSMRAKELANAVSNYIKDKQAIIEELKKLSFL